MTNIKVFIILGCSSFESSYKNSSSENCNESLGADDGTNFLQMIVEQKIMF